MHRRKFTVLLLTFLVARVTAVTAVPAVPAAAQEVIENGVAAPVSGVSRARGPVLRYWDASALVPLVVEEPASTKIRSLLEEDPRIDSIFDRSGHSHAPGRHHLPTA